MIISFGDKETEKLYYEQWSKKYPPQIIVRCLQILISINVANSLKDLIHPISNHLEPLIGKRSGQWSVRVNHKYRVTFTPINGGQDYKDVKIGDYH